MKFTARFLTHAAIIAAIYVAVTLLLAPISYGQLQVRVSEALTLLPILTPAAVPGLFVGCLLANIFNPAGASILDIVFGSLATLAAAFATFALRKKPALAAVPPVLINAIVVGIVLHVQFQLPLIATMGWVGLGQLIACYGLGFVLLWALRKLPARMFAK